MMALEIPLTARRIRGAIAGSEGAATEGAATAALASEEMGGEEASATLPCPADREELGVWHHGREGREDREPLGRARRDDAHAHQFA